jgi:hypothetical protein
MVASHSCVHADHSTREVLCGGFGIPLHGVEKLDTGAHLCNKGVTRMLQGVTRVLPLHPLMSSAWCYKSVTRVLQECYKSVTRVVQGCYNSVTRASQGCYKSVTFTPIDVKCMLASSSGKSPRHSKA